MEPVVRPSGFPCGELVILQVVAPDKNLHPVRALKSHRRHGFHGVSLLRVLPPLGLEPAGALQFGADLVEFSGAERPGELVQNTVEVFQLLLPLRNQLCQVLFCALELAVFLEPRIQVLLRCFHRVQRDRHQGGIFFVVVFTLQYAVPAADAVEVCLEQLRLTAGVFQFFSPAQLLRLSGEFALLPVAGAPHGLDQFLRPSLLQLLPFHGAVAAIQKLADAAAVGFRQGLSRSCLRFGAALFLLASEALRHRRQFIPQAGKQGAGSVFGERDAAQAVEDASVCSDENHICRSAHQFGDQAELRAVAKLVPALQSEGDQAVEVRLFDAFDTRAGQIFAQQHAEHGRFFGIFEALFREMHTGVGPGGTDQELSVLPFRAHRQKEQVLLRLLDLFNSSVCEAVGEFLRQRRDGCAVQCHCASVLRHGVKQFPDPVLPPREIQPAQQGFQPRRAVVFARVCMGGDSMDVAVPPALIHRRLFFAQQRQQALYGRRLGFCPDIGDGLPMQVVHRRRTS